MPPSRPPEAIRERLRPRRAHGQRPLGFENTYALAVRADVGASASGLADASATWPRHPELTRRLQLGLSRARRRLAGPARALRTWPGPSVRSDRARARLPGAGQRRQVDVIDVFSTDGRLTRPGLAVLRTTGASFPTYAAVLLARRDLVERLPAHVGAGCSEALVGRLDGARMAAAQRDGGPGRRSASGRSPRASWAARSPTPRGAVGAAGRELGRAHAGPPGAGARRGGGWRSCSACPWASWPRARRRSARLELLARSACCRRFPRWRC